MSFTEVGPPYRLPEMRPFRQIQQRVRLVGGAVVTENGVLSSDNYLAGVVGWAILGDGSVEFNNGNFRGDITGATGTFSGTIAASAIDIGGFDTSSFHVDGSGNMWLGAASFGSAPFQVSSTGVVTSTNASSAISGATITGGLVQTGTSGKRVSLTSSGLINFYNSSGVLVSSIGAEVSGILTFDSGANFGGTINVSNVDMNGTTYNQDGISVNGSGFTIQNSSGIVLDDPVQINSDLDLNGSLDISGTLTLASGTVSRGATDSGGAGFKLLRTPN